MLWRGEGAEAASAVATVGEEASRPGPSSARAPGSGASTRSMRRTRGGSSRMRDNYRLASPLIVDAARCRRVRFPVHAQGAARYQGSGGSAGRPSGRRRLEQPLADRHVEPAAELEADLAQGADRGEAEVRGQGEARLVLGADLGDHGVQAQGRRGGRGRPRRGPGPTPARRQPAAT